MAESNLRDKTVRGVAWSFVERFSVQAVTFVLELVIARLVGPDNFGLIAMLAIFMSVSQVFIDGGFSSALIQRKECNERDFSTVFYVNFGISLVIYALLFAAAPYIAEFFRQPILAPVARVYCFNLVLNSLVAVNKTKLTIAVDFKTQSKISLFSAIISGLTGVALAWLGYGVWALVVQALVQAVVTVALSFFYVRWWPRKRFSGDSFRRLFAFGSKLLVATLISSLYTKVYDMVIGRKFSSISLGLYSRADKFNMFCSANISGILSRVSFPVLSKIQDDDARLRSVYKQYMQLAALAVFPLIMGLCGIAKPLIHLLLGDEWMGCVPLLQILSFAYLWDCVVMVNLNLIYVKGRSDYVLRLEVIKKSIGFTILFLSLPFDLIGICIGRVIYAIIAFYLNTYYTKKLLDYGFLKQLRELLPILLLALLVAALSFGFSWLITNDWLSLAVSLTVCPVVYIVLCRWLHVEAFGKLMDLIRFRRHEKQ